jgi:intergrase/recombinase
MHFKYPKLFLRGKKNVYISFISENLINKIASSQPLTYATIRKRLNRYKLKMRLSELRDYYGSYLLQHNILEQEVNLLQGRIPVSVFIRHYWSPKLKELANRTPKRWRRWTSLVSISFSRYSKLFWKFICEISFVNIHIISIVSTLKLAKLC